MDAFELASVKVTVAVYVDLVSKSGAVAKVRTPVVGSIINSVPDTE